MQKYKNSIKQTYGIPYYYFNATTFICIFAY
jgi:hypothetical protein